MPASKRKTVAEKLISIVSKEVAKIPDYRKRVGPDSISLHDAIMSGFAVMHLKKPSLLESSYTWRVIWFLAMYFLIINIIVRRNNYDKINDAARWLWTWLLK